ncbi:MAG: hypothetical protein HKN26_09430, partial [Acidimicrobiales bacterium]|nr:hypothetical protein [Acidimicrobiales bacterium]
MSDADRTLVVDFVGEVSELAPGDMLTFGRDADLSIDDNQFLHRQLGRFEYKNGSWWVTNVGRTMALDVLDKASHSQSRVAPGRGAPIAFEHMVIRFTAGPTTYEI